MLLALVGFLAARSENYYAAEVYGMTRASHMRFGAACLLFAGAFAVAARVPALTVPLWGAFITIAVLYGASFVRGYGGER